MVVKLQRIFETLLKKQYFYYSISQKNFFQLLSIIQEISLYLH